MDNSEDFCQICGTTPKKHGKHYRHYNAICCLGCKAFFRRYIRGENQVAAFRCKGDQGRLCDLKTGLRTICKECRYKKCLQVGMEPSKVLGEEERKKFTHTHRRRNRAAASTSEAAEAMEDSNESHEAQEAQEVFIMESDQDSNESMMHLGSAQAESVIQSGYVQADQNYSWHHPQVLEHRNIFVMESDQDSNESVIQSGSAQVEQYGYDQADQRYLSWHHPQVLERRSSSDIWNVRSMQNVLNNPAFGVPSGMIPEDEPTLSYLIEQVQKSYIEANAEITHNKTLVNFVISGHLNIESWTSLQTKGYLEQLQINVPFFYHFASKNRTFQSLKIPDQRVLLDRNAIIFQEYVNARYLVADTGMDKFFRYLSIIGRI